MGHRVTLIPGDGTGPELTEATRRVLEATGVELDWDVRQAGLDVMEQAGTPLPEETLASVRASGIALRSARGSGRSMSHYGTSSSCTRACGHAEPTPVFGRVSRASIS